METSKESVQKLSLNILKLIQPDLLSVEELVNILRERSVGPNLLSQSKDKLVSLFKTVALPLPQREFRQNYRGSLLMKLRQKAVRKKIVVTSVDEHKSYTVGVNEAVRSTTSSSEQKCDRLKPPPELVNSAQKKIRLNSSSRSTEGQSNSSSNLDKIVIKKRKPSESNDLVIEKKNCVDNDKSEVDRLSSNSSESKSNDTCNGSKNSAPKKILLKRNHLTSTSSVTSSESTPEKSPSEPDKKRKPITWP